MIKSHIAFPSIIAAFLLTVSTSTPAEARKTPKNTDQNVFTPFNESDEYIEKVIASTPKASIEKFPFLPELTIEKAQQKHPNYRWKEVSLIHKGDIITELGSKSTNPRVVMFYEIDNAKAIAEKYAMATLGAYMKNTYRTGLQFLIEEPEAIEHNCWPWHKINFRATLSGKAYPRDKEAKGEWWYTCQATIRFKILLGYNWGQ